MRAFWALCCLALAGFFASGCSFNIPTSGTSVSRWGNQLTVTIEGAPPTKGSGKAIEESRKVEPFTGVHAHMAVEVTIERGEEPSAAVTVEADDNLLSLIETTVEEGELHIRVLDSLQTSNRLRVKVVASEALSDLHSSSSSRIIASTISGSEVRLSAGSSGLIEVNEVTGDEVQLSAGSSGHLKVGAIEAAQVRVSVDSSGKVDAAGQVDQQTVSASSSGDYDGSELASRTTRVDCSSSGRARVRASEEISGAASSSGDIRYFGDPARVNVGTSTSGRVGPG